MFAKSASLFLTQALAILNVGAQTSPTCGKSLEIVKITSSPTITTGQPFTIEWIPVLPDPPQTNTEVRVELWAMNSGPVNSPQSHLKSDLMFDTSKWTTTFPSNLVGATTKGGPIVWNVYVFVYSVWSNYSMIELPSWNIPYYGSQAVTFV